MTSSIKISPTTPDSAAQGPSSASQSRGRTAELGLGLFFGLIFGFLLQKGGVAKYEVLIGMLLLRDFTVIKVMMSAVVVGMIGIRALHRLGLIQLHIKPTRYGANILGGLLFGIGFGLAAYCPGTGAAALGQGNFDAIAVMLGLLAGSYVFAELSGFFARTVDHWGDRGELTFGRLFNLSSKVILPVATVLLLALLVVLHIFAPTP